MFQRALGFALTLMTAGGWLSLGVATAQSQQSQSVWLRDDTQHFEIHYVPALAPELARVVRSAERAYARVSGRLNFVLASKVPLVLFESTGSMPPPYRKCSATLGSRTRI